MVAYTADPITRDIAADFNDDPFLAIKEQERTGVEPPRNHIPIDSLQEIPTAGTRPNRRFAGPRPHRIPAGKRPSQTPAGPRPRVEPPQEKAKEACDDEQ